MRGVYWPPDSFKVITTDNDMFDELMKSVQEMDGIVKGQKQPTRRFEFHEPEMKSIREKMSVSQDKSRN